MIPALYGLFGTYLAANTDLAYKTTGVYTSSESGIFHAVLPDKPDQAVSMFIRQVNASDWDDADSYSLQIRMRGKRDDLTYAPTLSQTFYELLHANRHLQLGAFVLDSVRRINNMPLGLDSNQRYEVSDNYQFSVNQIIPNRP